MITTTINELSTLQEISNFLETNSGLNISSEDINLKLSVQRRMKESNSESIDQYKSILQSDTNEFKKLYDLVSTTETYFFRDLRQFRALEKFLLPEIVNMKKKGTTRRPKVTIMSCACSTGEETYSIAMAVKRSGLESMADFEITGFDLNSFAIEKAKEGIYTPHSFRERKASIDEYFEVHGENRKNKMVRSDIKRMVSFHVGNLKHLEQLPCEFINADIIFLRNALIYFKKSARLEILANLRTRLDSNGALFLGVAEMCLPDHLNLQSTEWNSGFFFRPTNATHLVSKKSKVTTTTIKDILKLVVPEASTVSKELTTFEKLPDKKLTPVKVHKQVISSYDKALWHIERKLFDEAKAEIVSHLKNAPHDLQMLSLLAYLYTEQGSLSLAKKTCQDTIQIDSLTTAPHYILGLIEFKEKNYTDAIINFKKSIYCDEYFYLAQYYQGLTYQLQGKHDKAQKLFMNTLESIDYHCEHSNDNCEHYMGASFF